MCVCVCVCTYRMFVFRAVLWESKCGLSHNQRRWECLVKAQDSVSGKTYTASIRNKNISSTYWSVFLCWCVCWLVCVCALHGGPGVALLSLWQRCCFCLVIGVDKETVTLLLWLVKSRGSTYLANNDFTWMTESYSNHSPPTPPLQLWCVWCVCGNMPHWNLQHLICLD